MQVSFPAGHTHLQVYTDPYLRAYQERESWEAIDIDIRSIMTAEQRSCLLTSNCYGERLSS